MSRNPFDLDTGALDVDLAQEQVDHETVLSLAEAKAIVEMTRTRGWSILSEFINGSIESNKQRLVMETDLDKVRRLQERTQAFMQVLSLVSSRVIEASAQAAQLGDSDADEDQPDPSDSSDNQENT